MHTLYHNISEVHVQRQAAKLEGDTRNVRAYEAVNGAILSANLIVDATVIRRSSGTAMVPSQTVIGVSYTVSGVLAGQGEPTCTCPAGQKGTICQHLVKVLRLSGATEAQLILYLGIYKGSKLGGYQALYAAMAAEQGRSGAAESAGAVGAAEQGRSGAAESAGAGGAAEQGRSGAAESAGAGGAAELHHQPPLCIAGAPGSAPGESQTLAW